MSVRQESTSRSEFEVLSTYKKNSRNINLTSFTNRNVRVHFQPLFDNSIRDRYSSKSRDYNPNIDSQSTLRRVTTPVSFKHMTGRESADKHRANAELKRELVVNEDALSTSIIPKGKALLSLDKMCGRDNHNQHNQFVPSINTSTFHITHHLDYIGSLSTIAYDKNRQRWDRKVCAQPSLNMAKMTGRQEAKLGLTSHLDYEPNHNQVLQPIESGARLNQSIQFNKQSNRKEEYKYQWLANIYTHRSHISGRGDKRQLDSNQVKDINKMFIPVEQRPRGTLKFQKMTGRDANKPGSSYYASGRRNVDLDYTPGYLALDKTVPSVDLFLQMGRSESVPIISKGVDTLLGQVEREMSKHGIKGSS